MEILAQATPAGTNEVLNTVNLVVTAAVTVIVAWLGVQRSRDKKQADERHKAAKVEREVIAAKADEMVAKTDAVVESVTPTNGYNTLGQALEGLEKRVNEMGERLARGDARFDNMERNEQRIAEQLAVVAQIVGKMVDKLSEVLALQADTRDDTRTLAESVAAHHRTWDDPGEDGGPSLLDWAEQQRLKDQQSKRRRRR